MPDTSALRVGLLMVRAQVDMLLALTEESAPVAEPTGCQHPSEALVKAGAMGSPNTRVCTLCGTQLDAEE